MAKFTEQQRMELIDVVGVLRDTFATVTEDGVRIGLERGLLSNGVRYSDVTTADTIRQMSSSAYAFEFYKVCGKRIEDDDFDEVVDAVLYVGNILGSISLDSLGIESIKAMATDEGIAEAKKYSGRRDHGGYC